MQLYLMRHGEAGPATRDAERRLTDRGRDDVAQVLRASRPRLDTPEAVLCSPLARARQTAAIALRELGGHADLLVTPALMPESSPHVVVDLLDDRVGPVMLVGHQPLMGRLLAWLTDHPELAGGFATAGLAVLELVAPGRGCGTLIWQMDPASL
jgi:phosphohistidine phosphatase